ncbi:MAG: HD domain-containing protein [Acidobacteriota bacterium]|nr:HD domain-containing protein [Blastocatellia bacterium]MDW8413209.1 HD domain-containing protein [Acidobacteriota bacterium]
MPSEQKSLAELQKLASSIDNHERYLHPHASKLAELAEALARRTGLGGADLDAIKLAALLHDIGELALDGELISQPVKFNLSTKINIQTHSILGEQQIAKHGISKQVQLLVRWHHEWWNGTGYPDCLCGEEIPLGARILRLVDTYDALSSLRPYREAFSKPEVRHIIAAFAGIEFDPQLVKIFLSMLEEEESYPIIDTTKDESFATAASQELTEEALDGNSSKKDDEKPQLDSI